jgi:type I restriction enzyme S subunit
MSDLPKGWAEAEIGELTDYVSRGRSPKYVEKSALPVINQRCVRWHGVDETFVKFVDPATWHQWDDERLVRRNDILWNSTGTGTIGRAALFTVLPSYDRAVVDSHVTIVRAGPAVNPAYLFGYIKSPAVQDKIEDMQSGSTNQVELNRSEIVSTIVPVAPLPEQQRIVAKVDGLTARTVRARKELDHIPTLIARYKSAVLALAFSGRLTQDWRFEMGRDALGAGEYPEGWAIKELEEISEIQGGIQVGKKRPESAELVEVPYLRVANVQRGWLNLDEIKTLDVTAAERDRLLLAYGDILMNEGGDRDKLGRGWIWRAQIPECIHQNHVFRIRLQDRSFPPEYVSHYANENGQRYFIDQGKQTTNLASISKRKVAALPVPVPPTDEAVEIVRRIESAFGWLDRVATDHAAATRHLPKLDAAILAKAFRGELVPQDPNDEPATKLLGRIKAEREAAPKAERGKKTRNTVSSKDLQTMAKNLEQVLAEAGDWISAQDAFQECGIGGSATTEEIEKIYAELRKLDKAGKLEAEPVNDEQGRKLHDRLRLKAA